MTMTAEIKTRCGTHFLCSFSVAHLPQADSSHYCQSSHILRYIFQLHAIFRSQAHDSHLLNPTSTSNCLWRMERRKHGSAVHRHKLRRLLKRCQFSLQKQISIRTVHLSLFAFVGVSDAAQFLHPLIIWKIHFSCCCWEKMVAALLAACALHEAVTDATNLDPLGKTVGTIADAYVHTGLAEYLSEASLTSHLSQLTIAVSESYDNSTELESHGDVENITQRSNHMHVRGTEDELSLKDSLTAVRNATRDAARIQAVFHAHSFLRNQMINAAQDENDMSEV